MLFQRDLLIAIGKTVANPATDSMVLCEGTIIRYSVLFPAGCAGLVHVQVWLGGFQLLPWSRGFWMRGDDHLVAGDTNYPVGAAPRLITVKGYNEDTAYSHTVTIMLEVRPTYHTLGEPPPEELLQELGFL